MKVNKNLKGIPKGLKTFLDGLNRRPVSRYATLMAEVNNNEIPDYVYNGLTDKDLEYDTSEYPVSGKFTGTTPAWLNNIQFVPSDWLWSELWAQNNVLRTNQGYAEAKYIDENVPKQTYTGKTTSEIIQQWYTQGMWNPSTLPKCDPPNPSEPDYSAPCDNRPIPLPIFDPEKIKRLTENWIVDDKEFARQRLGGGNPNVIKLADPDGYNIADWISKAANASDLSDLQKTLTDAQSAGQLYVCDYTSVVGPAVTNQYIYNGRFLEAPICFLTVDSSTGNTLLPAAIQIKGTDPSSYIFTPDDQNDPNKDAWLLAKLWTASADVQWWFSGSHLMNAHSIVMLFGIGVLNQINKGTLSPDNNMVILAKPFLTQVFSINNVVISAPNPPDTSTGQTPGIYQKGEFCDKILPTGRIGLYQIINSLYEDYVFDDNAFPTEMKNRGIKDGALMFPYYDDSKAWWDAINNFVGNIVDTSYKDDAAVTSDQGLMGWMKATETAFNHDGKTRFTAPTTKDSLKAVFTNLLFTCSAKHTSVNDTMLPAWAFTANGPFAMMAAAPKDAASVTQKTVLSSLPNPQNSDHLEVIKSQIGFVIAGTAVVDEEETAGMSQKDDSVMLKYHPYPDGSLQQQAVKDFWNAIWTGPDSVKAQIMNNQKTRIASWKGSTPVPFSLSYYYLSAFLSPCVGPEYLNSSTMTSIQI